jgi:histidinol-phosphate aminotransferase
VILQTFSKAWGMAGIRLGMAFASREIITILDHIKYPYNINVLTQRIALEQLTKIDDRDKWIRMILEQRGWLQKELLKLPLISNILPSDANFLMVRFNRPEEIFNYLIEQKIIVRDRTKVALCEGCLRITVGSPEENQFLVTALHKYPDR